jgi:hypothetical protein
MRARLRNELQLEYNSQIMIHEIVHIPSVGQSGREQLLQQCYDIRIDVFHREQGFPLDTEIDKLCLFV